MALGPTIEQVRKRDGHLEPFMSWKIAQAIEKALRASREADGERACILAAHVVGKVEDRFRARIPDVESIQDIVEETLIQHGLAATAKAYILYRQRRTEIREAKKLLGVQDDLKLSVNAVTVLEKRYLLRDDEGRVVETPGRMLRRVANAVASGEDAFAPGKSAEMAEEFYGLMARLEFLPNSPTLMNAGAPLGQLSACFVLPVEDSLRSIFRALGDMALIHQSGGGTGFDFSRLRPRGDMVRSTQGVASGPVSFMRVFDTATDVIKQGGKRRGANMGILRVDHPDIVTFIEAKTREKTLANFNISVAVPDAFMDAVEKGLDYPLVNPRTGRETGRVRAREIFDLIATMAWKTGDPGLVFIDEVNRGNPTPHVGPIEATNPCGELPLLPYESCNLGSVNLATMVANGRMDWEKLRRVVHLSVRFLDDVIEVNRYPLPEIAAITRANHKIGLGVMGFADALILLGVPYDSEEGVRTAESVMAFVRSEAEAASAVLARERGAFPNFKGSLRDRPGAHPLRNATVTSIAPTGTISIIAGCSSGIEPLFALAYVRNVLEGTRLLEAHPIFESVARQKGFYTPELMREVARSGSLAHVQGAPDDVRRLFVTDFDIAPEWHVRIQAAFQRHVDNSVSKTINLPPEASVEDVRKSFLMACRMKCKGITVYRYGSKHEQVLYRGGTLHESGEKVSHVTADPEFSGGCPGGGTCQF